MKKLFLILGMIVMFFGFSVQAHCGSCGVGGDKKECDGDDCHDHKDKSEESADSETSEGSEE